MIFKVMYLFRAKPQAATCEWTPKKISPNHQPTMNHANLWAPWRMSYLRELNRRAEEIVTETGERGDGDTPAASFFSDYWLHSENDIDNHVIYRNSHGMILLNRYPYANGHLLVALGDSRPRLLDYEPGQRAALWRLVDLATDLIERAINPQGINMGINQGEASGAGVAAHLHAHLVPRWNGDTNFISVVSNIRIIPDSLEEMAATYRATIESANLQTD